MKPAHSIYPGQSNVSSGPKYYPTVQDLSGQKAVLVKTAVVGGALGVDLPAAEPDVPFGILGDAANANEASVFFPSPGDTFRLSLFGAANPGDSLTSVGDGRVEAGGTGPAYAIAEEAGEDGQLILCRKL